MALRPSDDVGDSGRGSAQAPVRLRRMAYSMVLIGFFVGRRLGSHVRDRNGPVAASTFAITRSDRDSPGIRCSVGARPCGAVHWGDKTRSPSSSLASSNLRSADLAVSMHAAVPDRPSAPDPTSGCACPRRFSAAACAMLGAFYAWWPQITGRMMSEEVGKLQCWLTSSASTAFVPIHFLGGVGMPRASTPMRRGWDGFLERL